MSTELPENPDAESDTFLDEDGVLYDDDVTPEHGVLGFTLRELLILGVWTVTFIVSFFPLAGGPSIWGAGIQWILPIGVPTVAVFLLILRRFSPDGIRRVGSLGIDQFASVAFSVSAVIWVGTLWSAVSGLIEFGVFGLSWSGIVQLVASLALVALTVFAPIIPGLKEDFHGRLVTLAHRNANPVRPVISRPRPEPTLVADTTQDEVPADVEQSSAQEENDFSAQDDRFTVAPEPAVTTSYAQPAELDVELSGQQATDEIARFDIAGQVPIAAHASGGDTGTGDATADDEYVPNYSRRSRNQEIASDTASIEALLETAQTVEHSEPVEEVAAPIDDSVEDEETNPRDDLNAPQPFWILAPTERDVHDERGEPLFRIGPSAWALVIEDRGGAFVVRHDDGRIGYLHDISDITKG